MNSRPQGRFERLYEARQARDLELASRPEGHPRGFRYVPEIGDRVVSFVERYCKHHKGEWAGRPLLLEEWQKGVIRVAFGWLRADGTRRFRTLYAEIARKNGKSELAAALGLYLLVADGEAGAEVYASATKKDQARIVWSTAAAMVRASADLRRFVKAFRHSLHVERTDSKFEALGADSNTLDGLNPHGNIVDELHAHRDRGVWDVLDTAMGARRQPLTLAITTAGTYAPESIGWQTHEYATRVLDGSVEDDSFFAFIAAADEGDDLFGPIAQQKANPNYGISIKPEYLAAQAAKARTQPHFTNEYFRLHLNVWPQQVTRWLSLERWAECDPVQPTRELAAKREEALAGRMCFGGLDLSSKLDLSAFVLAFPSTTGDGVIDLVCRFWLPEGTIQAATRKGQRHFETWAREGWLTVTPGDVVDYDLIRDEVVALSKRFQIREIGFDPWNATQFSTQLQAAKLTPVEVRQGFATLSEPAKEFEARVVSRKIRHAGNPVLRFCVSNAVIARDPNGNIKPDKAKAVEKIDGVVAAIVALSRMVHAEPKKASPYKGRGILTLR